MERKEFKVAAVSDDTNSFGLRGHVFIARDGEAWEAAANNINEKKKGDVVHMGRSFDLAGFEIPRRLLDAPEDVIAEVWG